MNQLNKLRSNRGFRIACVLGVFALYLLVATYKLTNAALWYDEAVEFDVSSASLHGGDMYRQILETYQPPLYNFLLHFWLSINDGEWWFRFSGVVFGLAGVVGLFAAVRRATGRLAPALSAVVAFTFSIKILYYLQECAEYALLLGILPWLLYFYICLWQRPDWPGLIGWGLCCVLALYTQYGAVFPVAATAVCLFFHLLARRQPKVLLRWLAVCAACGIVGGAPLLLLYYLPQSANQASLPRSEAAMGSLAQAFTHFPKHLTQSFAWLFLHDAEGLVGVLLAAFLLLLTVGCLWVLLRRRGSMASGVVLSTVLCFVLFYIAAFGGWYGHPFWGDVNPFERRYALCLAPALLLAGVLVCHEGACALGKKLNRSKPGQAFVIPAVLCACLCVFCVRNWNHEIAENWVKDDTRALVSEWYALEAYKDTTLLTPSTTPTFRYYMRHNDQYLGEYDARIIYQPDPSTDVESCVAYLQSVWPDELPSSVFLPVSFKQSDFDILTQAFESLGYTVESLYFKDGAALRWASR